MRLRGLIHTLKKGFDVRKVGRERVEELFVLGWLMSIQSEGVKNGIDRRQLLRMLEYHIRFGGQLGVFRV